MKRRRGLYTDPKPTQRGHWVKSVRMSIQEMTIKVNHSQRKVQLPIRHPFLGRPRLTHHLRSLGYKVNEKRVDSWVSWACVPYTRRLSSKEHKVYPYLLRDIEHRSQSGLERGHHLRADAQGLHVSHGHPGLVQPLCDRLSPVEQPGQLLLYRSPESGAVDSHPFDLQHRSGQAVHRP